MNRFTNRGFLLLFLSSIFSPSIAGDTLTPLRPLIDGQTLVSASGRFVLGFFSPAGLKDRYVGIWYGQVSDFTVVWVANRRNPITGGTGILTLANNGSLIITADNSTALWSSGVSGMHNPVAQLLDRGNFVVREMNNADSENFVWQSFDHPTDTFLPGMKLGWDLATGLNRNITAWTSATDPSPGRYSVAMEVQGDPQLVLLDGSSRVWRSGRWDGLDFTDVAEILTLNKFVYTFVNNQNEVYFMFDVMSDSFLSKVTVDSNGTVKRMDWINESAQWSVFWYAPKGLCDYISSCGPYGVCIENEPPSCICLPGFEPKSPARWALGDGRDGCVRKTALDCRSGTDGFVTFNRSKLPDTMNETVDMNLSLEECRTKCLSNCLCTAYASADIRNGGSGCVIWTSELMDLMVYVDSVPDLYVHLASSDLGPISNNTKKRKKPFVLIIVGVVLGILVVSSMIFLTLTKRKRKEGLITPNQYQHDHASEVNLDIPLFDMRTIAFATNNFSEHSKIGEGGFGPVYKGKLEEGEEIAVKRLDKSSTQGLDEFKNEATLIARLQHRNLVRLLGCCIEGEERMLVYEYMPNKSLDAILFEKSKGAILNWQTRFRIIMGIARGLLYLHQDSRFKIIHRDLKASNVLLDEELNPKISDFGMARIFRADETEANTKKVVGTYGYMSPEYVWDGIFSVKSDVYSFGVLVLEIISGKKNKASYLSQPHENLLVHAWSLWQEGNGLDIVDDLLGHSFPLNEVLRCITIGLLCVQEVPEDRPTMSAVVLMLSSDDMLLPQPGKPGFVLGRDFFKMKLGSSPTSKQGMCSVNNLTVSALGGR